MSESTAVNNNTENLPWLIFTLRSHYYAIHSRYVTGIMVPPDSITPVPEAPDIYRGVVEIRSEVYPVLDMRKMFGFPSIDTECKEFTEMMDAREKDYIEWVTSLNVPLKRTPSSLSPPTLMPANLAYGTMISANIQPTAAMC